jgi:hypothetical protein
MNITFKKLFLLANCTLVFFTVRAQNSVNPLEDMVNAIKNDRVADMAQYFDNFVPITINNAQSVYSHNQAQVVLRDFFEKNLPKDFIVMENGSPDNSSKFMIGSFDTQNAKFSVYILMKLKEGNYLIQDFRLNKE